MELDVPDVSMGPTDQQKIAPPAKWWNEAHDRALICGTFKWGFGKYNDIRDDEELAFAWDFKGKVAPEEEKKKKLRMTLRYLSMRVGMEICLEFKSLSKEASTAYKNKKTTSRILHSGQLFILQLRKDMLMLQRC